MLKEALQYILDGMRPEIQDLCGRAYVITHSGAQEVIETPIAPDTVPLHIWRNSGNGQSSIGASLIFPSWSPWRWARNRTG